MSLALGGVLNNLGWYAILLAALVLLGIADIHPGVLLDLLGRLLRLLAGLLG